MNSISKKFKLQLLPKHLKKYPTMKFAKHQIINVDHKIKKMPDFSKFEGKPFPVEYVKYRLPSKVRKAMYNHFLIVKATTTRLPSFQ